MGRRRTAVYVFGTGEPPASDCPGAGCRARYGKKLRKGKRRSKGGAPDGRQAGA